MLLSNNDILKRFFSIFAIVSCLISCVDADPEDIGRNEELIIPAEKYEVISDDIYEFREYIDGLLNQEDSFIDFSTYGNLISAQLDMCLQKLNTKYGLTDEVIGFRRVTYLYESMDQYGNKAELSSLAYWLGYFDDGEWYDLSPDNICLMEHYTITSVDECPTNSIVLEPFVLGNTLVIMPDYIGYGVTADMVHPYLNHGLCALNSIDALTAGFTAFRDISESDLAEGWQLEVMGASQGGGNALAVHKYMDTHKDFAQTWHFSGSYCAAGPYDPCLTVDKYFEAGVTDSPVLFVLTIKAMYDSYPEILGRFDKDSMYSDKFLGIRDSIEGMVDSKEYSTSMINFKIISKLSPGNVEIALSDILSTEMLDKDSDICMAFYECLGKNDLTSGWEPINPIRLYYSEADKTVPCDNAIAVLDAFGDDRVTLEKGPSFRHSISCAMWMLKLLGESYAD